jgi:hypothetical protein
MNLGHASNKKLPKVNIRPSSENSPNLVTLLTTYLGVVFSACQLTALKSIHMYVSTNTYPLSSFRSKYRRVYTYRYWKQTVIFIHTKNVSKKMQWWENTKSVSKK